MMSLAPLVFLSALATSLLLNTFCLFRYVLISPSKTRTYLVRLSLSGLVVVFLFLGLEFVFYFFFVQSADSGYPLAEGRWLEKYWKPINSLGYRDRNHPPADFGGKRVIFVLGDSFAAGWGIEDPRQRFADLLQDKLGDPWTIVNISQPKWDTSLEYDALVHYPYRPDIIILSYLANDIERVCAAELGSFSVPPLIRNSLGIWAINYSYFLNYAYWTSIRELVPIGTQYYDYVRECSANDRVWQAHQGDLQKIVDYATENRARMIAVVFPELRAIDLTRPCTDKTTTWMRQRDVFVIDLAERLAGRSPAELIVNRHDGHPSVGLHREISEMLYEVIHGP